MAVVVFAAVLVVLVILVDECCPSCAVYKEARED